MKICRFCFEVFNDGQYSGKTYTIKETIEIVDVHDLYCHMTTQIILSGEEKFQ